MSDTLKIFNESKNFCEKHKKYFPIYDHLFSSYIDKEITFVEIGISKGGSLHIWKKFFGPKARIIGIDINPECKILEKDGFEVFIGNQSDPDFWIDFFNKVGKVDIILDDGGHTNYEQITTTTSCVPNINDGGMMVVEDTHTSYMVEFSNPNKYSFINFSKKIIDDINFTFPGLYYFKYSLNKYIYSIEYFESFVAFKIDKSMCTINNQIMNQENAYNKLDYGSSRRRKYVGDIKNNNIFKKVAKKLLLYKHNISKILKNRSTIKKYKKFFGKMELMK